MTYLGNPQNVIRLGEFEFDLQAGCLVKRGLKVRLRSQLLTVLTALLELPGEVVTREELQKRLWPGGVQVDFEINLNTIIARLREALGDSAAHPRYIETMPKRGYRLLRPAMMKKATEKRWKNSIAVLPFADLSPERDQESIRQMFSSRASPCLAGFSSGKC